MPGRGGGHSSTGTEQCDPGRRFNILQNHTEYAGSVHYRDAQGQHETEMLNPKANGETFIFEVDNA